MRLGCIDIGSNTTRLLVADCDGPTLTWVHQERAFTAIGRELLSRGELGPAKIAEVVAVVAAQLQSARRLGVVSPRTVGTAALRSAQNREQLTRAIAADTGLTVEVLSEAEEARLAFVGVALTLEHVCNGELGVVDVGGGSSELVVGAAPGAVRWWASLAVGSALLTHTYLVSDPPAAPELIAARARIEEELATLRVPRPALAVAVGGSATSLARLAGLALEPAVLSDALKLLTAAPAATVATRWAIDPERARLLPAGLLILSAVADAFGVPLQVGRGGIREGVLLEASRE